MVRESELKSFDAVAKASLKLFFYTKANIGFAPLQHDISIVDIPVRDINFQPVRADLEGRIVCLGDDCAPVEISIVSAADAGNAAKTKKKLTGPKGEFSFGGLYICSPI